MSQENKQKLQALYEARKAEAEKDPVADALNECVDLIKMYLKDKIKLQSIAEDLSTAYGLKISSAKVNEFIKKKRLVRAGKKTAKKATRKPEATVKVFHCPKCKAELKLVTNQAGTNQYYKCPSCNSAFKRNADNSVGEKY